MDQPDRASTSGIPSIAVSRNQKYFSSRTHSPKIVEIRNYRGCKFLRPGASQLESAKESARGLSADAIEFFKEQSKDKLPGAPLFTEDGETPWRRHIWARAMRAAIVRARSAGGKRPPPSGLYRWSALRIAAVACAIAARTAGVSVIGFNKAKS